MLSRQREDSRLAKAPLGVMAPPEDLQLVGIVKKIEVQNAIAYYEAKDGAEGSVRVLNRLLIDMGDRTSLVRSTVDDSTLELIESAKEFALRDA